ncbi:hypothetical protein TRVL_04226 [Trypanosoma vivax]|uniref:Selenoprotein F/M domain-containing protein n=1 Tax=Trypanosoma vivax (strain Y486) TaxID=1055687 RepID=G0UA25_TRYVY|nr:hypothetical protein TRVL_04226 [Trypanosoma vivax]CCC52656.1 conserved hypothetical protein [Trypanosoma vivax Y486]
MTSQKRRHLLSPSLTSLKLFPLSLDDHKPLVQVVKVHVEVYRKGKMLRISSIFATLIASFCACALVCRTCGAAGQSSGVECQRLGFRRNTVDCHHCQLLYQHTMSSQLRDECLSCCTKRHGVDGPSYKHARIEVVEGVVKDVGGSMDYDAFVASHKDIFADRVLVVRSALIHTTQVILISENGEESVMRVHDWPEEALRDYLIHALGVEDDVIKK